VAIDETCFMDRLYAKLRCSILIVRWATRTASRLVMIFSAMNSCKLAEPLQPRTASVPIEDQCPP